MVLGDYHDPARPGLCVLIHLADLGDFFAPLVLVERLTSAKLAAAAFGFVGVWIVAQPDFSRIDHGVLAAIGAAFFYAATTLMTKALTKGEAIVGILF